MKGRDNKFWDACNKCNDVLIDQLHEEKHDLKDAKMWKIIENNDDYVKKIIASRNIKAKVCFYLFLMKIGIVSNFNVLVKQAKVLLKQL